MQTLKEMQPLKEHGILPDNNNEIFRRGLHCLKVLAAFDQSYFVKAILRWTEDFELPFRPPPELYFSIHHFQNAIDQARENASLAFCVIMAREGAQKADMFYSIIKLLDSLQDDFSKLAQGKDVNLSLNEPLPEEITKKALQIRSAIATYFV